MYTYDNNIFLNDRFCYPCLDSGGSKTQGKFDKSKIIVFLGFGKKDTDTMYTKENNFKVPNF